MMTSSKAVVHTIHRSNLPMFVLVIILTASLKTVVVAKQNTAMFVFGDSLADTGNNNYLKSFTKANFKPYGIDMPDHSPTGRYCNGRLVPDFISDFMGSESVLPYLNPNAKGEVLERGVNFASAGAGILLDTGAIFHERLEFAAQLDSFAKVRQSLISGRLGENGTNALLSSAIYLISVGSNDYINNYMLPFSRRIKEFGLVEYQNLLIGTLRHHIQALYDMGARKIGVSNLGPLGCLPAQLALRSKNGSCINQLNRIAFSYNHGLKRMLESMNKQLLDAHLVYIDTYNVAMDYLLHPASGVDRKLGRVRVSPEQFLNLGPNERAADELCADLSQVMDPTHSNRNVACCGMGPYNGLIVCNPFAPLCSNRSEYVFWDPFHPTEAFNAHFASRIMHGSLKDVSPINLQQLLDLPT